MHLPEFELSPYGLSSSRPSPVNRMMAAFAADFRPEKDINLGVGYVNERTIPNELILSALGEVLADPEKHRAALNYGSPRGSANLIGSIKDFLTNRKAGGLTREILDQKEIVIGPSGATSLLEAIAHLLKPGIVITPDPMYYIYCNYLERMGFRVVTVPEDGDGMRIDLLEDKLRRLGDRAAGLSFFYVVTVNNPTGTIFSNARKTALIHTAARLSERLGRKVPVVLDRAYEDLLHDPALAPVRSGLLDDAHGLVLEIGTLSKILSPALRIGYLVGSESPFLQAMIQKTSDVGFSAPLITQEIASRLLDHHAGTQIQKVNRGYRQKAQAVRAEIDEKLEGLLDGCSGGQAGFYFYLTFRSVETTEGSPFFRFLSRTTGTPEIDGPPEDKSPRVLYVPGQFCVHPEGDLVEAGRKQLRLSYGFEETGRIVQALDLMYEAARYAKRTGG